MHRRRSVSYCRPMDYGWANASSHLEVYMDVVYKEIKETGNSSEVESCLFLFLTRPKDMQ